MQQAQSLDELSFPFYGAHIGPAQARNPIRARREGRAPLAKVPIQPRPPHRQLRPRKSPCPIHHEPACALDIYRQIGRRAVLQVTVDRFGVTPPPASPEACLAEHLSPVREKAGGRRCFGLCGTAWWRNFAHSGLCLCTSRKTLQTQSQLVASAAQPVKKTLLLITPLTD